MQKTSDSSNLKGSLKDPQYFLTEIYHSSLAIQHSIALTSYLQVFFVPFILLQLRILVHCYYTVIGRVSEKCYSFHRCLFNLVNFYPVSFHFHLSFIFTLQIAFNLMTLQS